MARRTVAAYSGDAFGTVETIGTAGVFGEVMGFVAITVGFFTLGAYLGRDVTGVLSFVLFLAAFGCFIGLNFVRSQGIALTLLFAAGLLLGFGLIAFGPHCIAYIIGWLIILGCLVLEHWIARRRSLNWINLAFFRLNALVGVIFLVVVAVEVIFQGGFKLR